MQPDVRPPAIIFDFDGTIADSFPLMLRVAHELIGKKFQKDDVSKLRGMSSRQLLHELKIPLWRAFFLAARGRRFMSKHLEEVALILGIDEAIRILSSSYTLYILSSNSKANVRSFLKLHKLEMYFSDIYGDIAPWRKARALRKLSRKCRLTPSHTWYVGDGDLDVKAAHKAGMQAVAVAWGFSNIHVLKDCHPEVLVFTSDELIRHFMSNEEKV